MSTQALVLGGIPALVMAVSTYIGLGKNVPGDLEGALQHFAAGVLLCTVGTELLPEMVKAEGLAENVAAGVGFFMGVTLLILIGMFAPEEDAGQDMECDETPATESEAESPVGASPTLEQKLRNRQPKFIIAGRRFRQRQTPLRSNSNPKLFLKKSFSMPSERDNLLSEAATPVEPNYTDIEKSKRKDPPKQQETEFIAGKAFPLQFVFAVAIDSCLDGLLIGIASAAGKSAGPMMSASLSVEMGFLGLTLSTALSGQPFSKASVAALVGPFCLVIAAGLGGVLAQTLSHSPVAMVGMFSFGTSALLFMVSEELLLDAHEDGEHVWWVDLQLYTGFFASVLAGKLFG